ncbi:MAG TPA: histidine phosphatase family protein [Alphaproteobacteria bacterium]|nr:histidine phosphatase family protein [Alphaproteobacteria bacterium]
MPKLYLLRHAQASSSLHTDDKGRSLTPHGTEQAKAIAKHLRDVDLALCSSAKRTQMTLNAAQENGADIKKTDIMDKLYNAGAGDILSILQEQDKDNILIVAHNPGIHQLANLLAGKGTSSQLMQLQLAYAPATLSVLDCPITNWRDIQPQGNELIDLIIPD